VDLVTLTEVNSTWDLLLYDQWLPARTRGWWELAQRSIGHNKCNAFWDVQQPGREAILSITTLAHHATMAGDDNTGLGQWSWGCFQGKENRHIQVVLVYCPCPSIGHLSANQQQTRWFSSQGQDCCPHDRILTDLSKQISTWQAAGDQVIVVGDVNKDMQVDPIASMFNNVGLKKAIVSTHREHLTHTIAGNLQ